MLCFLTFIFSVTGTFLVRSGILNSVHTFANDPSRGLYILIFLTLMIFLSSYNTNDVDKMPFSDDSVLVSPNIIICLKIKLLG